jgi:hypothetical protein
VPVKVFIVPSAQAPRLALALLRIAYRSRVTMRREGRWTVLRWFG